MALLQLAGRASAMQLAAIDSMASYFYNHYEEVKAMAKKVLFVVTSHGELGDTGKPTGYWLSEVTHPWSVLRDKFEIDVVSPKGGKPPVEGVELDDTINRKFWDDPVWQKKMANTMKPDQVRPEEYAAIFYAGGHGVMWDFPDNAALAKIAQTIHDQGGIVSAVCHGPAGLLNVHLDNGEYLIKGKKLTSFTNKEEELIGMAKVVPFLLQTALESKGCIYEASAPWSDHVVADGRLLTGQNPMSALSLGKKLLELLS